MMKTIFLRVLPTAITALLATGLPAADYPLAPRLVGNWSIVARDPDLGPLTNPSQQPVDFGLDNDAVQEHAQGFPTKEYLWDRTVPGYNTSDAGVNLIITAVDRADPRPVWFQNWGTDHGSDPSNLKRALDRVLAERGQAGYAKFKNRILLCSADKFGDHTTTIAPPWRLWVQPSLPNMDGGNWYHRFGPLTATAGGFDLRRDVLTHHGPLGALYPTNTNIRQKEGDSDYFLYLIPTGMNDPMRPGWGSWAGRFGVRDAEPRHPNYYWANLRDVWQNTTNRDNTLKRWVADLQNDFRARLDWCVKPFAEANHPPLAALNGDTTKRILAFAAQPGSTVKLSAAGSTDPDRHALSYQWAVYPEAGTYPKEVRIAQVDSAETSVLVPADAGAKEIHVILTVRDHGEPPLASYRRAVIKVDANRFSPVPDLASQPEFPDPLVMSDGRRVTTREQWYNERRPELIALFQHYMYGFLPPPPKELAGKIERNDRTAFKGRATIKEVTVTFGPPQLPPIHLMLVVPNHREGPAPVILGLNYFGNHTVVRDPAVGLSTNWMPERGEGVVNHRATEASRGTWVDIWQIEKTIARGYAVATFYNGDIDPDRPGQRGIQTHYRKQDPQYDCGTIGAWAWGLQRAVDYLVTDPDLDRSRIIVTGHSRLGKAALLAAALDQRIALAIPHQAGCGGSAPSRTTIKRAETVKQINDQFPYWFNARFKEFNDRPDQLPFDQHCLVALCAPRPVLFTNGRQDIWINPEGQFEVLRAAAPVYRFLGAGDFSATELPPDGKLIDGALGYFLRPGGHSLRPEDWKAFLDFADTHLGQPTKPRSVSLLTGTQSTAVNEPENRSAAFVEAPRWEMHEFELRGHSQVGNPFSDDVLVGEFTAPSGKTITVEGFYDGDNTWRLRFAPDEEGDWRYRLRGEAVGIIQEGRLHCTPPRGHGFLRVHPQNPYAFAHADGTAFFPMGDTCYGLYDDSHITPALRREYLETRRRQRFNFVRMSVGHSEARAAADPAFWAWGGTAVEPDLDRLNPVFFHGLDELFRDLQARGMNVELILLNFYRRPFTDTNLWTPARERLWLRYVVARYAAFNNVFLWTLANEYETHPDGRYRLERPGDMEWAKATARLVKVLDPYRHLVTVHPVVSSSTRGVSPRDPFDLPWRIGEFFGESDAIDVLSQQTGQSGKGVTWDEQLQCWVGDDPNLVESLRADRRFHKPVLNTESGYEYLRGQPTEKKQVHHTDKVRRSAWRVVCAGGYFAAGFHGTIGHSDAWNRIDAPNRYPFTVQDEGVANQLGALYDFFNALPFWRMRPFEGVTGEATVALAEPGQVYVVYLPHGGNMTMDLGAAKGRMVARWFNPRDGKFGEAFTVAGGQRVALAAPDDNDWTLLLKR